MPALKTEILKALIDKYISKVKEEAGEFNLMLSGGIDSSLLAAIGDPDRVFSVKLPYGPKYDEFDDIEKVVKHLGLEKKWVVISLDDSDIHNTMRKAVKAIGRPIPHFNIFPLYVLFEAVHKMGIKTIVSGDGPDESMCGYTRHLIMDYLYKIFDMEAFSEYRPLMSKILGDPIEVYSKIIGKKPSEVMDVARGCNLQYGMCATDMNLMRRDMDDMSDGLAKHFGINLYRPYQYEEIDNFMFSLPPEDKIHNVEFGKYLLRLLASEYLPADIAWRKQKIGGPLVPMNKLLGIDEPEFSKNGYLKYQEGILNG